jgi:replicative DNA helicase
LVHQCEDREPARDIASRFSRSLGEVADLSPGSELIPMPASTIATSRAIDSAHANRDEPARRSGITTGVNVIDGIIPSIEPGELMILAARPGVGKSALAALIARNVAFMGGKVLFFSLEMPHVQLTTRILAMTSGVSLPALRGHRPMSEAEKDTVHRTLTNEVSQLPIHYCYRCGLTAEQIASETRTYARKIGRPSLVIVDYLQLLRAERLGDNRNYQIGAMTKTLRNVAGEVGTPMLVLAQMNRQSESESREPKLSDLRDSGEIEQDADLVTFLHLPQPNTNGAAEIDVSFIVAKQRQGQVGKVELKYTRKTTLFSDRGVPM